MSIAIPETLQSLGQYIGGQWTGPGERVSELRNPATGEVLARVSQADRDDAKAAVEAAAKAFPAWDRLGGYRRAQFLQKVRERLATVKEPLAQTITLEMGKVLTESRAEVEGALDNFDYYNAYARTLVGHEVALLPDGESLRLHLEPRGVTIAITPWNFPASTVTRKLCPILLSGNTVVLKPSSSTPLSATLIVEAFHQAGVPPGVINLVVGPGGEVGDALVQHPETRTVTLTGSTESGRKVMEKASQGIVKVLLELGGKAPVIVARDADLRHAARATVYARFWNAGQSCIAGERVYVQEEVQEPFLRMVREIVDSLRVGPGWEPSVDMGPLVDVSARDRVQKEVEEARGQGASVVSGGQPVDPEVFRRGAFYPPTLATDVEDDSPLVKKEIFGPVLPVLGVEDLDEAIERANRGVYGLSSYVFTKDVTVAERAAKRLRFGEVYINRVGPESPQGYHAGYRQSGLGGEGSLFGILDYMNVKSIYTDWSVPHNTQGWMPYSH
jgi:acyl-CoA reductase-like NAD-dependent aldehyde dehydrogenase